MSYSQFFFRSNQAKIPTFVSLLILVVIMGFMVRFFSAAPLQSKASKKTLRQIQILNLSSNGADIFWEGDAKEIGWLVYGGQSNRFDKTAFDERDLTSKKNSYFFHLSRITDLEPKKRYYFKIVSNNQIISESNGEPFSFVTLEEKRKDSAIKSLYGKVIRNDGTPLENAVVMLTTSRGTFFGALTKVTGEWLIVLSDSQIVPDDRVTLVVYSEDKKKTTIKAKVKDMSPVPQTVIIGQDYEFGSEEQVLSAQSEDVPKKTAEVDIVFPQEGMVVPGQNPLIKGVALPDVELIISVHSPVEYSFRTKAGKDGTWKVNVPQNLTPGEHSITVLTKNKKGEEMKIERKFFIAKSGEQVLGEATGSATPTSTPIPTPIPTASLYPTEIPTKSPPRSGNNNAVAFSFVSGGFIILGLGILLAF